VEAEEHPRGHEHPPEDRPLGRRHLQPQPQRPPEPVRHRLGQAQRSEEHTSELQSQSNLVCRLLLEKKKKKKKKKKQTKQKKTKNKKESNNNIIICNTIHNNKRRNDKTVSISQNSHK